jgi:hypothetical protein
MIRSKLFRLGLWSIAAAFASVSLLGCVYAPPRHGTHRKVVIEKYPHPHKRAVYHRHCTVHKRVDDCDWRRESDRHDHRDDRWAQSDRDRKSPYDHGRYDRKDDGRGHDSHRREDWGRDDRSDDRDRKDDRNRGDDRNRDQRGPNDRDRDDRTWGNRAWGDQG